MVSEYSSYGADVEIIVFKQWDKAENKEIFSRKKYSRHIFKRFYKRQFGPLERKEGALSCYNGEELIYMDYE